MYLIKQVAEEVSGQTLEVNDVISIDKKWYVVTEELGLEDKLMMRGLRNGVNYTINAIQAFGKVREFRKIGKIVEDRWIEDLSPDLRLKELLEKQMNLNKKKDEDKTDNKSEDKILN